MMRVWTCTDHDCVWPVGVASAVVAATEEEARALLDAELVARSLKPFAQEKYTLIELDLTAPGALILRDGDY